MSPAKGVLLDIKVGITSCNRTFYHPIFFRSYWDYRLYCKKQFFVMLCLQQMPVCNVTPG